IATGTRPIVPGEWRQVGDRLVTSDDVFEMVSPGRRVGVVGLGPIGVELAQAFAQLGCEVHAFTNGATIAALNDPEVNASLLDALGDGMSITTGATVTVRPDEAGVVVDDGDRAVTVDWVLAAIGRQ